MSGSLNRVMLIGNLTKDPEVRSMQNGSKVCNISMATNESWKDKTTGERKERAEFHRVVIFNEPLINVAERFLKKGSKVYLEGQIETRKWSDQSGAEKFSTEIVLRPYRGELTLLDSKDGQAQQPQQRQAAEKPAASYGGGYGASATFDQEVPF